ncbi:MAG TPA: heavy metal-binding domain-containing protein [Acidobacteriota bacterium]|nr:heavy metal-binding domain-containing protein [Acidobacteriota bacterium]
MNHQIQAVQSLCVSFFAIFLVFSAPSLVQGKPLLNGEAAMRVQDHHYTCPMHADVTSDLPGDCNKCGMKLTPRSKDEKRIQAQISLETSPSVVMPGKPFVARFKVTDGTGTAIRRFEVVHEKLLHLMIVSRDLSYFDHIHPSLAGNVFSIKTKVPKAGNYRMFADFVPTGGDQVIGKLDFSTSGKPTDPVPLVADTSMTKIFGTVEVTLTHSTPTLKAGESLSLTFSLADAKTKKPITTLRPYLGAMGHCVILDQSATEYLHSHPEESGGTHHEHSNGQAEHHHAPQGLGGPDVSFHTQFPKPGLYKIWGQFNHQGKILTAEYVVDVK